MEEPINIPEGCAIELKKDGKSIPIQSLADLREKIAAEAALRKHEAQRKSKEEEEKARAAKEKDDRMEYICGLIEQVYDEMIHNISDPNEQTCKEVNIAFEKMLNEVMIPYMLPGYKALVTIAHCTKTLIDGRVVHECTPGLGIRLLTIEEYDKAIAGAKFPGHKCLCNKHDIKQISEATLKKPCKTSGKKK